MTQPPQYCPHCDTMYEPSVEDCNCPFVSYDDEEEVVQPHLKSQPVLERYHELPCLWFYDEEEESK